MEQLKDEMSKGQISFEMVKEAMQDATSEGGQFNGAMEKQSKTLSGLFSTLKDNFNALSGKIMKPVFDLAKKGIESLLPIVDNISIMFDKVTDAFGKVGGMLKEFDDPMVAISELFKNVFGIEIPDTVYNMVEGVIGYWNTLWTIIKDAFDTIAVPIFDALKEIFDSTGITANTVFTLIGDYFKACIEVLTFMWDSVGKPVFEAIMSIVGVVKDIFVQYMPMIQETFSTVINDIVDIWNNNLKPMFDAIVDFIVNTLVPQWKWVFENIIGPVFGALVKFIGDAWTNGIKPIFTGIIDFITGVFSGSWSKAWDGVVSIFKGIFGGLVSIAKVPINAVINMVNKMIGGLNKISLPDWIPGIGGKGINIPTIPMLYKGTDYFQGSNAFGNVAMVGEQGPELVELPTGSKVNTAEETKKMGSGENLFVLNIDGREFMRAVAGYQDEFDNYNSRSPKFA